MAARLDGKVAIVTGGAQGNGLGIALALAREGADIALVDRAETVADARLRVEELGRRCLALVADVADEAAVKRVVDETSRTLGGIDVLVNNAGIFPRRTIEEATVEDFHRVIGVNLLGPWLLAKHTVAELKRRGGGAIVNITSASGHYGGAFPGFTLYGASKGGLRQMTSELAAELGEHGIRVNAIAPGQILTEGTGGRAAFEQGGFALGAALSPLGRIGSPDEVGRAVAFLASDDASFITGTTLILDGGAMAVWTTQAIADRYPSDTSTMDR